MSRYLTYPNQRQHRGGRKQSQIRVKHLRKKVYDGQDKEFSQSKYSVQDSVPSAQDDIKPPVQNGSVNLNTKEFIEYDKIRGTVSSRRDMPPPPPTPAFPGMNIPVAPPRPPLPPPTPPPPVEGGMTAPPPEPKKLDARTDLLEAIRTGMKLRKVQGETEKKEQQNVGMDVTSIHQRRIAVEYSDSESETGSEWDDDDDDWQDEDED
ncbi:wiskott-Aldrich syndrome protein family member 2-like [Xenia sp. Carnegie-2017]|uniref:wiskott-Aldrich syndrome protein family member 2-like n=1 Tax=Xenia sp. Carnegie-2017 TaxID=2897299 RepID=UPI001F033EFF|nr:wiskott-Aldrich syndrome protein family member 2-like [Xenia sp. Carnegie-2017]